MLLNDFFTINSQEKTATTIDSQIQLNVNHPIYKGHFPSQPVVPGVCMMQILAELTSHALNKKVSIQSSSQSKFLIPIIPSKFPNLSVQIAYAETEENTLKITGSIHTEEITFFKFKGLFS